MMLGRLCVTKIVDNIQNEVVKLAVTAAYNIMILFCHMVLT